jgi:glyoxylase-like metal-dependent hydrolase (beta-lactamase superfamily II)
VDQIGPDLFRLTSGGFAAPYLIMGDVPTLVDTGAPGRGPALEGELRAAGIRIERIVLTHGDPDHVGGSDHLRRHTGAEVCASHAERSLIDRSGWPSLPRRRRTAANLPAPALMNLSFLTVPAWLVFFGIIVARAETAAAPMMLPRVAEA